MEGDILPMRVPYVTVKILQDTSTFFTSISGIYRRHHGGESTSVMFVVVAQRKSSSKTDDEVSIVGG